MSDFPSSIADEINVGENLASSKSSISAQLFVLVEAGSQAVVANVSLFPAPSMVQSNQVLPRTRSLRPLPLIQLPEGMLGWRWALRLDVWHLPILLYQMLGLP